MRLLIRSTALIIPFCNFSQRIKRERVQQDQYYLAQALQSACLQGNTAARTVEVPSSVASVAWRSGILSGILAMPFSRAAGEKRLSDIDGGVRRREKK
jgi:hypothetical protein